VVVLRDGRRVTLQVEVGLLSDKEVAAATPPEGGGEGTDAPAAENPAQMFGLGIGPITEASRSTYKLEPSVEGVLVTSVAPGSEADEKGLKPGDVIVQVSQKTVADPKDVTARFDELKSEGRRTVMLLVSGAEKKLRFISLRFDE
jgi:serine protease Do